MNYRASRIVKLFHRLQKRNTFGVALRKKPSHPKCNPEPEFCADANKSLKRSYCIYELRITVQGISIIGAAKRTKGNVQSHRRISILIAFKL